MFNISEIIYLLYLFIEKMCRFNQAGVDLTM